MSILNNFLKYWLPVILWAGLIFYLSAVPNLSSGLGAFWDVFWRKLAHATEFGFLNLLLFRALAGSAWSFKKAWWWSLILAVLYAVSDELHQSFVPTRECRWQDMAQDSLGVLLISSCLYLWRRFKIIKAN